MTISGGGSKNVEIYVLDYDNNGRPRSMTVDAINGDTGSVLDTQSVSSFTNGKYLNYSVKGHIKFKFTVTSGDNAVFSGVFFDPGTGGPTSTKVDDDNASMTFGGIWTDDNNYAKAYLSTRHYTNSTGAYSQFTFTGTAVKWIGETDLNRGYADIYIDGNFDASIDTYSPTEVNQVLLYTKTGLASSSHTIKVVCKGTKNPSSSNYYITTDAFEYTN